ncbi:putative oxidoreductase, aryl-alcohol dehydrogenase like protein [Rivularia sp. PCC 7116]|uniref:aldo/keto reductase n=1 Tax=Rivularia sp. PCC 7116 TaxID=373994 RepID=UPI00029F08E3|nr:aldo/keto reductase [Rivularia sp. PCC 7116]AFY52905.1 putative oxidoreductase, aryl-alcohol dehydrogenase like protein [Rivularia sp. PCC 7116]
METTELGKSRISTSVIGLGGMPMSVYERPCESQSINVIHRALDSGITFIDTADSYCKDESDKHHNERLIHKALQSYDGDTSNVIVATKGGLMRPNQNWIRNGNPEHLRETIRVSFAAFGGNKPIDIWQLHAPDPDYTIEASLTPAKEAQTAGTIKMIGVSNFSVEQIKQARDVVDIISVQNQYSPWQRQPEMDGVLEYCENEGLTFIPWSPFGGRRRHNKLTDIQVIKNLAQEKNVSVYCIVLAWFRSKSPCILPIPGASKVSSIEDSVKAVDIKLSAAEVQKIDRETS